MVRCKVVFNDNGDKRVDGETDVSDPNLVKVLCDDGRTVYIAKSKIIFIRELGP